VALAFLAALQHLPARQRAVLILREVLAWRAEEVADMLDMTVVAVNSALQRARTAMSRLPSTYRAETSPLAADPGVGLLLRQYVQAWEGADVQRLVTLLHDDAVLTMPPVPAWYRGRAAIAEFLRAHLFAGNAVGRYRLVPTRANGGPAFAVYTRGDDGVYRAAAVQVLSIADGRIAAIHDFLALDGRLFARFGLDPAGSR
jgi:RNA polymerase sigma-70 factor (ECF subfamily)